jgi:O-antigen/teichoic acid export membrane protein
MKNVKKIYISGGILTATVMAAYLINFIFNAFLGRVLTFEAFGLITFLNILFYIINIFYNAITITINQHVAYIDTNDNQNEISQFIKYSTKRIMLISTILACLWLLSSPFITTFFQIGNPLIVDLFALVILLYPIVFIGKGYMQGKFLFISVAIITIFEALVKLLGAVFLVFLHQENLVYLSLYISSLLTVLLVILIMLLRRDWKIMQSKNSKSSFPLKLYINSLITGLSTISFLAIDVILVKHFMDPYLAGQYSLLSLIGKIIYFLGSLLNVFIITLVSKYEAKKKNPLVDFYKILLGSCLLAGAGYIGLGIFGQTFVPILFGKKAVAILPYLNLYTLTILLFTIGNSIVTFHLAKKQFLFPALSLFASILFIMGIILFHNSIEQIVNTIFITSIISTIILLVPHLIMKNKSKEVTYE